MKPQEEKKRMKSSTSSCSFQIDLISEILSRLPEKSVIRFRCVSKLWSSITTDPYFIDLFETQNPRPSLLLFLRKEKEFLVTSIPQQLHTLSNYPNKKYSFERYHTIFPVNPEVNFLPPTTESVQGLICFQHSSGTPLIWNPSTRQFLTLPKPRKSWNDLRVFLGFDPIEGKHKVLCIPLRKYKRAWVRVLTLGSSSANEESWRRVKLNHNHVPDNSTDGRCIKGVLYYEAHHKRESVIMSFDVRSERFDMMIQLPSDMYSSDMYHMRTFTSYKGRLAFVEHYRMGNRLWILEDAEKHKWSSKEFLDQQSKRLVSGLVPNAFTEAGEFVYVPSTFSKPYDILFYDPERNSFRTFRFEGMGIGDDDYDGNRGTNWFKAIPNHIQNQMCF